VTSHLVEGRPLPDAVAGHPALELCNTRAIWGSPAPKEYLHDYLTFALWAREHEILTPDETEALRAESSAEPQLAVRELRRVLRVRDLIYAAVTADPPTPDPPTSDAPIDAFQRQVVRAVRVSSYRHPVAGGPLELDGGPLTLGLPGNRVVLLGHDLLTHHGPDAVGRCFGEGCGWVFLDPSRRRHWCRMAVCGNRAKAKAYAARRREASMGNRREASAQQVQAEADG
jgi:predicted RNA-binding Zn ribbon-like protein